MGVDQWFVESAITLKIPFDAAIPFVGQESRWNATAQAYYRSLLGFARSVIVVSPGSYEPWKMHRRNEYPVDHSHEMITVFDGKPNGGTSNCVAYAAKQGRIMHLINPLHYNPEG